MKTAKQIQELRTAINTGRITPGEMVGTELAFAHKWQLSRTAVRHGIDQLVEEGLLERRPGKGLFVRSPFATTHTIQIIVPSLNWTFMAQIARGAQNEGRQRGVQIQICDAEGQMNYDLEVIRNLPNGNTDGAIIVSLHHRKFSEILCELKAVDYPFVVVDQQMNEIDVPSIMHDNYAGGYLVGQKIVELGHKKPVFVGPIEIIKSRLDGFRDALLDGGVLFSRSMILDLNGDRGVTGWFERLPETEEHIVALLSSPDRPTVIFDGSADLTPFIYRAARRVGLSIPEDLSVVTFDDPFATHLYPEVARLQHRWFEMGQQAIEMLFKRMSRSPKDGITSEEQRVIPVEWVGAPSLSRPYR